MVSKKRISITWWIWLFHAGVMSILVGTNYDCSAFISKLLIPAGIVLGAVGAAGIIIAAHRAPRQCSSCYDYVDWLDPP